METKKILLADDEEPVRALVAATLTTEPCYEVLESATGPQTLETVWREMPDLVLLDGLMPGLDGFEVCRRLKASAETRGIAIIMLTALAQETDRQRALDAGADGYLAKPFSPIDLLDRVREAVKCQERLPLACLTSPHP